MAGYMDYDGSNAVANAIGYASHYSRSQGAVIRVYDQAGNVIETHDSVQSGKEEEAQANLTAARLNHADLTTDTILADAKLTHADLSACHFGTRFAAIRASRKSSPR